MEKIIPEMFSVKSSFEKLTQLKDLPSLSKMTELLNSIELIVKLIIQNETKNLDFFEYFFKL